MGLTYQSTRGGKKEVAASTAVLQGLAKDGGLSMSSDIPGLDVPLEKLTSMTCQETAHKVTKLLLTNYIETELKDCIVRAYDSKFDTEEIASPAKADGAYYPELYHGNTIAFRDMVLSILPHFMTTAARRNHVDREIITFTVTSGDTGKAAMAGFAGVPGTRIIVFYPKDRVGKIQELQMRIQKEDNTPAVAVHGNFDDAQTGVREIFGDKDLEAELAGEGFRSSSANSINIGRLVPRIIYYAYAYAKLLEAEEIDKDEKINVVMPTGNLGNILVAYFAKRMGLPIKMPVCTSSDDKILYNFSTTRIYDRKREFILTSSPSVDVPISSNLEHLIYLNAGCDARVNTALMRGFSGEGRYEVTPEMCASMSGFAGGFATQERDAATIRRLFDDMGYPIDTHTGVTVAVYTNYRRENGDGIKAVTASTVSPYKLPHSVMKATAGREGLEGKDEFETMDALGAPSGVAVPRIAKGIRHAAVRHNKECGVGDMKNEVKDILGIS